MAALLVSLTGCIGMDGSASLSDRVLPDPAVLDPAAPPTFDPSSPEPAIADAASSGPSSPQRSAPWHNQTGVASLADCRILYNLVSAGIPEAQLPFHVSVPLDAAGGYQVFLRADGSLATPSSLAAELCIGFTSDDRRVGYSDATSGTVPAGADRMFIAGDLLQTVDIAVHVGPDVPLPAGWTQGPWPLLEREGQAVIIVA